MKPSLFLLLAASAVSNAQTAAPTVTAADRYSVSIDKYEVVRDGDDFDGLGLAAKARFSDNLRAVFAWGDASSDTFTLVPGADLELDASRLSLGVEYDLPVGPGGVTLSLAYAQTSAEAEGGVTGDAFDNNQFVLGARYEQALGGGFSFALAASHFVNDFEGKGAQAAALANRYEDSPTSLGATLAYEVRRNISVHLTYATEDALLGLSGADNTISFGLKATF